MEKNNKKISAYEKIRNDFYKRIKEIEKKEKKEVIALSLATFLLAAAFLVAASFIETSGKGKYVYVYGDYEQSINADVCFSNGVQLIDMNALASYCGLSKEEANYVVTYKINNTYVSFENESKIATVNGIKKEMPEKAQIKNGYCLIPLSVANEILYGIEISAGEKSATVTMKNNIYIFGKNPKTDVSSNLEYINSKDEYIYTLANKQHPLDRNFPENQQMLVEIPAKYRKEDAIKMHYIAEKALEAMMDDMFALGYTDTYVTSAYRSYTYQETLFDIYVEKEMATGLTKSEATAKVLTYSSEPGKSEHQTGLCVDFMTRSMNDLDNTFSETAVFEWLVENSWKYGFVLRYPEDKVDITGYTYESWHYRFVGFEVAAVMHQTGLCYEEYLKIFTNKE